MIEKIFKWVEMFWVYLIGFALCGLTVVVFCGMLFVIYQAISVAITGELNWGA